MDETYTNQNGDTVNVKFNAKRHFGGYTQHFIFNVKGKDISTTNEFYSFIKDSRR